MNNVFRVHLRRFLQQGTHVPDKSQTLAFDQCAENRILHFVLPCSRRMSSRNIAVEWRITSSRPDAVELFSNNHHRHSFDLVARAFAAAFWVNRLREQGSERAQF